MGLLRRANREEIVRHTTPDGEDWIELRAELSKGEVNAILSQAPSGNQDVEGGLAFLELFFEKTIVAWSASEGENLPLLPTVENYRSLEANGARWVDETLGEHLQRVIGRTVDETEGKPLS